MHDRPALPDWTRPEYAPALASRDVGAIFRALKAHGWKQRQIAHTAGMGETETSEVIRDLRKVKMVDVLERVAKAFEVPPGLMGLAFSSSASTGKPGVQPPDLVKHSLSRMIGDEAVLHVNYLLEPSPEYKRIGQSDAHVFNQYFLAIQRIEQEVSGQLLPAQALIAQLRRMLRADMSEAVRARLSPMQGWINSFAGWCATDKGDYDLAMWHFSEALRIAGEHGDHLGTCRALFSAGKTEMHYGDPKQALKLYQLAVVPAGMLRSNLYNAGLAAHSAWAVSSIEGSDKQHIKRYIGHTWNSYEAVKPEREYEDMMAFFNETDIRAVTGQAQVITSPEAAIADLSKALKGRKPDSRSAAFESATLAQAFLSAGYGDKAAETGYKAIKLADGISSRRTPVRFAPLKLAAYKHGSRDMTDLAEAIRRKVK
jgi:transcriptional regulator with XRE-family HTH domain